MTDNAPNPRLAYADLDLEPLVGALEAALGDPADAGAAQRLARALFPLETRPGPAIADLVLCSQGPFAQLARRGVADDDRRLRVAARELDALSRLAHADIARLLEPHGLEDALSDGAVDGQRPSEYALLRAELLAASGWG
ncbi:MAG: hypothetical protein ABI317_06280, partial [Gaiellales bacterium]